MGAFAYTLIAWKITKLSHHGETRSETQMLEMYQFITYTSMYLIMLRLKLYWSVLLV